MQAEFGAVPSHCACTTGKVSSHAPWMGSAIEMGMQEGGSCEREREREERRGGERREREKEKDTRAHTRVRKVPQQQVPHMSARLSPRECVVSQNRK